MIPKFRGLSIDEKSKGEWQYGHLIEDRGRAFIINEVVEANEQYITIGSWCPVNPATLGQSTGLRDKNGKEVFIGDIVKCTRFTFLKNLEVEIEKIERRRTQNVRQRTFQISKHSTHNRLKKARIRNQKPRCSKWANCRNKQTYRNYRNQNRR
ncbi:phage conserved hypothetical protein [Streptococcus pneumoniae]|nr:phage conserved hypothetical protein [Streptococcus pneumoniae]CEZ02555.1 phage conserved hypothetical protein [Streptococcus pneumoniae]CJN03559.1 phage conserved hypothetical protein [Streptococcus pneumoniae]CJN13407.1 phage conserved hypothetical protein [Streptococcus pneumoniae]CJN19624.1 phage conserved hypothetical protein [Streptococcus pneumoniae]